MLVISTVQFLLLTIIFLISGIQFRQVKNVIVTTKNAVELIKMCPPSKRMGKTQIFLTPFIICRRAKVTIGKCFKSETVEIFFSFSNFLKTI